MAKKMIYFFGGKQTEGKQDMKALLGGKGANLASMAQQGFQVPPGFTITTEVCIDYHRNGGKVPAGLDEDMKKYVKMLEKETGKELGGKTNPLLVSVRSGALFSMPGMMDTILNLGLNDQTVEALTKKTKNERFAWDSYRRFIAMFGDVAMDVEKAHFEHALRDMKKKKGYGNDTDMKTADWKELVKQFKAIYKKQTGKDFPQDPMEQLKLARNAVFASWNNPRAVVYRNMNKIDHDLGTAVNIQSMVFGNMGNTSATGVAFTRDPSTGENILFGEYLINAQGEDVVAGIRTGKQIAKDMPKELPKAYKELLKIKTQLEKHYRDVQDFEFTIEDGKLYMLQTRNGKRTARAALKIAVDLQKEGLITKEAALLQVDPNQLEQLLHPSFSPKAKYTPLTKGAVGTPGAGVGRIVFDPEEAVEWHNRGESIILVREETCPDDIKGMAVAKGIVTVVGGATAHAIVVGRQMGKACVCGCKEIVLDQVNKTMTVGDTVLKEGDWLSVDGGKCDVVHGKVDVEVPKQDKYYDTFMKWIGEKLEMGVWANADTPEHAKQSREFGATGIGLCRTEHMFFAPDRLPHVQDMIMATVNYFHRDEAVRAKARARVKRDIDILLKFQEEDFYGILKAMDGYTVTIRLLDPPLHEFLPHEADLMDKIKLTVPTLENLPEIKKTIEEVEIVRSLHEVNPMLGHRGCRLGLTYDELYEMQVEAIMRAACRLKKEKKNPKPDIMIPLVALEGELKQLRAMSERIAENVMKETGVKVEYHIGTMIELPRACAVADQIAQHAEFFSFGTNDLTQTTFGFSRDDAERKFFAVYADKKVMPINPFEALDQVGVGELMKMAVTKARSVRPDIKLGICGEHGGEPTSVDFCYRLGLAYVSCSPKRIPVALHASVIATLRHGSRGKKAAKPAAVKTPKAKPEAKKSRKAGK